MKKQLLNITFLSLLVYPILSCNKDKTPVINTSITCTDTISFNQQILPMITDNCIGCHNGGQSPTITNHSQISNNASSILSSLKGTTQLMPEGGPALPDSIIQQFECWMNQGKLNN